MDIAPNQQGEKISEGRELTIPAETYVHCMVRERLAETWRRKPEEYETIGGA
mgnify:CR=1 FL=1